MEREKIIKIITGNCKICNKKLIKTIYLNFMYKNFIDNKNICIKCYKKSCI